ncbi:AAA family ATPase [Nocardioides sp. B-3]|uniref:AAA family ATPase n=1 Tax=Nocardioides sp. B-3 TaxID=2895565 RepID=UPI0021539101|nr:SMC family ATPase [Nocardioides sp. B-3]UUZ59064.1 SMC family ATPase [Nocardioides sp. B-3]
MRLHSLSITAFGPFADTVEVDFDTLSGSGLFLLSGPTGAGKSSVLDAVCFALYGDVPGDRSTAGRLRCDRAGEGVAPRVRLEVTLSGRRFRIERSPKWERPKKRGTGMTTEQASVVISERVDDGWQPLSTRLDETGHLVTGLVGLTLTQFCRVAMLPQGRFRAFLRARSEDRHALLRQVFRTGRFDRIEQWLRERRLDLQRSSTDHGRALAQLLGRVSESAGQPMPATWDISDLSLDAADGGVVSWVTGCVSSRRDRRGEGDLGVLGCRPARGHVGRLPCQRTSRSGPPGRARGRDDAARRARRVRARTESGAVSGRRARDSAGRPRSCGRPGRPPRRAAPTRSGVHHRCPGCGSRLPAKRLRPTTSCPRSRRRRAARSTRPRRRAPMPSACTSSRGSAPRSPSCSRRPRRQSSASRPRSTRLLGARRQSRKPPASAHSAQVRLPALAATLAPAHERAGAATELVSATAVLTDLRRERETARDVLTRLKETRLEVREAGLDGMAAEIAGALAVGADCPVCGSHDHPRPAVATAGSPDAATERAARKDVDDAEGLLVVLDDQLRQSEAHHTRLLTVADGLTGDDAARAPGRGPAGARRGRRPRGDAHRLGRRGGRSTRRRRQPASSPGHGGSAMHRHGGPAGAPHQRASTTARPHRGAARGQRLPDRHRAVHAAPASARRTGPGL